MEKSWKLGARIIGLSVCLSMLTFTARSKAHEPEWEDHDFAHDRARRAVIRGEILPMAQLLNRVYARIPGELVGVEFERHYGLWVYEFKIVDKAGRLREVHVNAQSGEILAIEDE